SVIVVEGNLAAATTDDALVEARRRVEREIGAPARPREILTLARMPLLPSGKPDRVRLRAQIPTL
ncbi:MAG: acyl-CoA synthetase, partial [Micrococcales bacterium]|nr:acyl-CoA synthetase [Micrococcales bacterium]